MLSAKRIADGPLVFVSRQFILGRVFVGKVLSYNFGVMHVDVFD